MRSRAVRLSLVVLAMALLAACTDDPNPSQSPSPSQSATSASPEPTSLHVAVYGGDTAKALYQKVVDAFVDAHPGLDVDLVSYANWNAAQQSLTKAAGTASMPDVFLIDHSGLPVMVAKKAVAPLGEALVDRGLDFGDGYLRPAVLAFSAEADLQCMPNDISPFVVFYNPKLVRLHQLAKVGEASPTPADGWSWAQFVRAARRAHQQGASGVYVPPSFDLFGTLVKAAGGHFLDDPEHPTTIRLGEDSSAEAVDQVLGLIRSARLSLTLPEVREESPSARFTDGKLGMLIGTRAMVPAFREAGMNFDVMPLPKIRSTPSLTRMNGLCVSSASAAPDLAIDFVAFAVGDVGASILARSGSVVPSNTDVLASDAFTISGVGPGNGFVFLDSVQRSPIPPYSAQWTAAEEAAAPYVRGLYYGPDDLVPSRIVGLVAKVTVALTPLAEPGS